MKTMQKEKIVYGILAFIILGFPCFVTGPLFASDTREYVGMYAYLPALYPIFLRILRFLFGDVLFVYAAVFLQTLLAACVVVWLLELLCENFQLPRSVKVITFILLLLTYFKVDEHRLACNVWILTEGLSYSLFYVFVCFSIKFFRERTYAAYAKLLLSTVLLMLCRTQFIVCFGMLVLYVGCLFIFKYMEVKRLLFMAAGIAGGFILVSIAQSGYEKIADQTDMKMFNLLTIGTHFYYYSTEEDAVKIENVSERQLFLDIHEEILKNDYQYKGSEATWLEGINDYQNTFREIRGVITAEITEYVRNMGIEGNMEVDKMAGEVLGRQINALHSHFWLWVWDSLKQLPVSMVKVIAFWPENERVIALRGFFIIYSLIAYCSYFILNIILLVRKKHLQKENVFCIFLMIFTLVNVVITELTIRSMIRYIAYSFGMFYIAELLTFLALIRKESGDQEAHEG